MAYDTLASSNPRPPQTKPAGVTRCNMAIMDGIDGAILKTCTEAAEVAGVSRQTLWRWRQEGLIPLGKTGQNRTTVFSQTEVEVIVAFAANGGGSSAPTDLVYLDSAASARPTEAVRQAVLQAMSHSFGNASSPHTAGRRSRDLVERARDHVACLAGTTSGSVMFTSGGTEANNIVIQSALRLGRRKLFASEVEHASVLDCVASVSDDIEIELLPVDNNGLVIIHEDVWKTIDESTLFSLQCANNETGVQQDVMAIANRVRSLGGLTHCDAAQSFGKVSISFDTSPIDFLTCSAHKIHGPQGVGAVFFKDRSALSANQFGGTQEYSLRAGTENVPGIHGFGVAAASRQESLTRVAKHCELLRNQFEHEITLRLPGVEVVGSNSPRIGTISNIRIPGIDGQAMIAQLDARGVRISQGSACTNMRPEPSHVLRAMGYSELEAYECLRVSFAEDNQYQDVRRVVEDICGIATQLGYKPTEPTGKEVA